jgi:thiosulfate dehydrogenase [quinone] large subunit
MQNSLGLSSLQQTALVALRTLVGWHFLYEGYTKLLQPAWGRAGAPLAAWSSAGYLKAATGPLADMFHSLGNASWIATLDVAVAALLVAVGLSLMVGLFTQTGCIGALGLLAMFYLSAIPVGLPEARAEGTYLIVNKNLIEAAAVLVLLSFRTGLIAGLDRQRLRPERERGWADSATATPSAAEASRRRGPASAEKRHLTPTRESAL